MTTYQIYLRFLKENDLYKSYLEIIHRYNFGKKYEYNSSGFTEFVRLTTSIIKLKETDKLPYGGLLNLFSAIVVNSHKTFENYSCGLSVVTRDLSVMFEKMYFEMKFHKTSKELFDDFLKYFEGYDNYYSNTNKLEPFRSYHRDNKSFMYHMINDAFKWSETPEGDAYWGTMEMRLNKYVRYLYNGIIPSFEDIKLKITPLEKALYT